ncbi:hypothetical protein [uncultured Thiocystis sp.]|jgi:hypothetical protein|uniref:hypothetical protein n=1 Tax=uncultured Thiocystis sp. TaxID=1202134 RepID=UPI0025E31B81|nr:hypothetical protein [uncultured Thiocystis sp.]
MNNFYVIQVTGGSSTIGHHVAERRRRQVLDWLGLPCADLPLGSDELLKAYHAAMRLGEAHHQRTGKRCPALLTPELIGLEKTRVAILDPKGRETRRFWVGKSTGWMPVHLSLPRINTRGGFPVDLDPGDQVRIVRRQRI